MNVGFLIIVAVPLAVYLVVLLFSMRGIGADEHVAEHAAGASPAKVAAEQLPHTDATEDAVAAGALESDEAEILPVSAATQEPTGLATEPDAAASERVSAVATIQEPEDTEPAEPTATTATALAVPDGGDTSTPDESYTGADQVTAPEAAAPAEPETVADTARADEPQVATETVSPTAEATTTPGTKPSSIVEPPEPEEPGPILPEGPVILPDKGSPKYAFDYRGRLWVEKKRKGFFRQLRRPQIPPEDPSGNSQR